MKNSKRIIIILILLFLFLLFCFMSAIVIIMKKEKSADNSTNTVTNTIIAEKRNTIKDVIEKHDSEYISETRDTVYVILANDLYDENGKSNRDSIVDLVNDLNEFFKNISFYIIDQEKNVTIYAKRKANADDFDLIINGNENFYDETDGRDYSAVDNAKIVEASNLLISNPYLERLDMKSMYFKYIEDLLSEGRESDDGYTIYPEEKIKIKLLPNKSVFNLIFIDDYEDKILYDLSLSQSLRETAELYDDYVFGGLDKEYLGYRSGNFYYFFYEHEASIYPYSYKENTKFETILAEYLESKDLKEFVRKLKISVKSYSELEYDEDIQKLFMAYPTRGIKIDIRDNDAKGITLYSNYNFTDTTKQFVKEGKIQYNKDDYVNEYEQMRKEAE